ncbi:MAG: S9 family peptidase [Bacteroidales bacterium]
MRRAVGALIVFVCLASPSARVSAQGRGLLPQDYYRENTVGEVTVAPNSSFVAFTVTTVVEHQNRRHREVWLQRLRDGMPSGPPFRLTDPTLDASAPRWSPDGATLAYTCRTTKDPNAFWFAPVWPTPGPPHHVRGVEGVPLWSPDGRWIAYTKEVTRAAGDKRVGTIAANALSDTLDAERFDGRVVTTSRYKRDGSVELLPDPAVRQRSQIFVVASGGGTPHPVTSVTFDIAGVAWSRDSRLLLFSGDELQDDEYNPVMTDDVYVVPREGGRLTAITENPGGDRSPAWCPVADKIAFVAAQSRNAKPNVFVADVGRDGRFLRAPRNLTARWDLTPGPPSWTPDGRAIRFEAEVAGNVHLFEVPAGGGAVTEVVAGNRTISSTATSADGRVLAFVADDATTPTEVFVARIDGSGERRATTFNDEWLHGIVRMEPERLTWRVADGTEIEGWLVKPVGFAAGRKYPLVLKIHGGPHGQYGNTWFGTFHILSNAGMFVLYCNPRGSTGYGYRFMYATRGRWGEMDSEDVLKGIDTAAARHPEIDTNRLGVSGGSYGGFMTNWLTATTGRFAAAVTSRSIANWESWYGESDSQGLTEYEFYGPPWEQRDLYRRLSPISHVEKVKTPTLIIEGENDYRTPIGEGEQWFMALKKRRVPVELVRYPRSSHGLSRTGEPWLLVDRLERIRSWFVRWLVTAPAIATE